MHGRLLALVRTGVLDMIALLKRSAIAQIAMTEFLAGAAVATYLLGVSYFAWDEIRPRTISRTPFWYWIAIAFWPVAVAIAPLTRWAYRRWHKTPGMRAKEGRTR
jgi:hypothetical protein